MSRKGQGRTYRDGQGRAVETSRSHGGIAYPERRQLHLSVAEGIIVVDGLGGIEGRELSGVRDVAIDVNDLVVFLDRRLLHSEYYPRADQQLFGGALPDVLILGCEPHQDRFIIRGVDAAGVQVDLGGRGPRRFIFKAERRVA